MKLTGTKICGCLLAALGLALLAPAPGICAGKKGAPPLKKLDFKKDIVYYPARWAADRKNFEDLVSLTLSDNWNGQPHACGQPMAPWAWVTIGVTIAPCEVTHQKYYAPVRQMPVTGVMGTFYNLVNLPPNGGFANSEGCPGVASRYLEFVKNRRCFRMTFITRDEWLKNYSSNFKQIIKDFVVKD